MAQPGTRAPNVEVSRSGSVVRLVLNRPEKLNALDRLSWNQLDAAITAVSTDRDVSVIVLTGKGRAFTSGADLAEAQNTATSSEPVLSDVQFHSVSPIETIRRLQEVPQATFAVVNGLCVGIGITLMCACDLRLASSSAWFSLPELVQGLPLSHAIAASLAAEIGISRTSELVFTGRRLMAEEAHALGLVHWIADADELPAREAELCGSLSGLHPGARVRVKRRLVTIRRALYPSEPPLYPSEPPEEGER